MTSQFIGVSSVRTLNHLVYERTSISQGVCAIYFLKISTHYNPSTCGNSVFTEYVSGDEEIAVLVISVFHSLSAVCVRHVTHMEGHPYINVFRISMFFHIKIAKMNNAELKKVLHGNELRYVLF